MPQLTPNTSGPPALQSLLRRFAMALSEVKFKTAGEASTALRKARTPRKKREVINTAFDEWREHSGAEIRRFFPQYVDLALAYPNDIGSDAVSWAEEQVWIPLYGQCGVEKNDEFNPHRSDSVIWWLAVAINGNFGVNKPGTPPWYAPKWLAKDLDETDKLIMDLSRFLSARFVGVLDGEMEGARVKVAIARSSAQRSERIKSLSQAPIESRGQRLRNYRWSPRERVVFGALQAKFEGLDYCRHLDDRRVLISRQWKEEGCPGTYVEAYKDPRWRQQIQDQKSKLRKKYDALSSAEQAIAVNGTRRHSPMASKS